MFLLRWNINVATIHLIAPSPYLRISFILHSAILYSLSSSQPIHISMHLYCQKFHSTLLSSIPCPLVYAIHRSSHRFASRSSIRFASLLLTYLPFRPPLLPLFDPLRISSPLLYPLIFSTLHFNLRLLSPSLPPIPFRIPPFCATPYQILTIV